MSAPRCAQCQQRTDLEGRHLDTGVLACNRHFTPFEQIMEALHDGEIAARTFNPDGLRLVAGQLIGLADVMQAAEAVDR